MIYGLVKQTLIILQDKLRIVGHFKDVKRINDFIEKTEKMVNEFSNDDVDAVEKFDLDNHLNNVYTLIDEYKNYLLDTKIHLIVPTTKK